MNKLIKIGIAGGLIFGAYKLIQMKSTSGKIVSTLSNPRIHKLDESGIAYRTEIKIQNPTQSSLTITKPVVTLTTNGKPLTNSSPEAKTYTIRPLATTNLGTIELTIPWKSMLGYAAGILLKLPALKAAFAKKDMKAVMAGLGIPIEMKYSLYANNIFYESAPQKL